jgi:hypothetical protein
MRKGLLRFGTVVGGTALVALSAAGLLHCYSDEDESVDLPTACEVASLRTDPGEATLRLYVETAIELRNRANALQKSVIDVCNEINRASGAEQGNDVALACNRIADRIGAAQRIPPAPDGGIRPPWAVMSYDEAICTNSVEVEADCVAKCGGTCAAATACPAGSRKGTCGGTCKGTCTVPTEGTACVGECRGTCATPDGGTPCAAGAECVGTCNAATWVGRCETGCDLGFLGKCGGTCNGTCDGQPVGQQPSPPSDGGTADGGDAGAPADAGPPGPAPGGADGNCTGICTGTCSATASGSCRQRCRGAFSGGECTGGPARCVGACVGLAACTTTCDGKCANVTAACTGECTGECTQPTGPSSCGIPTTCEANAQCKSICALKGTLAGKCEPPKFVGVRLAGDDALYVALKANLAKLVALGLEGTAINEKALALGNVSVDDYNKIGASRDRARLCVIEGSKIVAEARATLAKSVSAAQVLRGFKF